MRILFIKLSRYLHLNRPPRLPQCYLLSSKFILTIMISLVIYFFTMDIILIFKCKKRGSLIKQNEELLLSSTSTLVSTLFQSTDPSQQLPQQQQPQQQQSRGIFYPLPVKKIMMADGTHYIRSPLAEFIETTFKFSEIFPFISANAISLTHCLLSIISTKFLIDDSLFKRQLGVCLFQFRNFLDSFDGVIYRAHAKKLVYKSHYGSFGYFIDAFSDVFGGICLMCAIGYYLIKHPPPNKNRTKCFRIAVDDIESNVSSSSSSSSSNLSLNSSSPSSNDYYYTKLSNNEKLNCNGNCNKVDVSISGNNENSNNLIATSLVIVISVTLCGIRLAVSALFWDRSVHAYEDLLDCASKNQLHEHIQINVLKSNITLFIMLSWRFLNALSLQDFILTAIFIDKIWEFIVKTQYIGWILLFGLILLTELHVAEIRSILFQASQSV